MRLGSVASAAGVTQASSGSSTRQRRHRQDWFNSFDWTGCSCRKSSLSLFCQVSPFRCGIGCLRWQRRAASLFGLLSACSARFRLLSGFFYIFFSWPVYGLSWRSSLRCTAAADADSDGQKGAYTANWRTLEDCGGQERPKSFLLTAAVAEQ